MPHAETLFRFYMRTFAKAPAFPVSTCLSRKCDTPSESGAIDGGDSLMTDIASTGVMPRICPPDHKTGPYYLFCIPVHQRQVLQQASRTGSRFDQAAEWLAEDVSEDDGQADADAEKLPMPRARFHGTHSRTPEVHEGSRRAQLEPVHRSEQQAVCAQCQEILESAARYARVAAVACSGATSAKWR